MRTIYSAVGSRFRHVETCRFGKTRHCLAFVMSAVRRSAVETSRVCTAATPYVRHVERSRSRHRFQDKLRRETSRVRNAANAHVCQTACVRHFELVEKSPEVGSPRQDLSTRSGAAARSAADMMGNARTVSMNNPGERNRSAERSISWQRDHCTSTRVSTNHRKNTARPFLPLRATQRLRDTRACSPRPVSFRIFIYT